MPHCLDNGAGNGQHAAEGSPMLGSCSSCVPGGRIPGTMRPYSATQTMFWTLEMDETRRGHTNLQNMYLVPSSELCMG